MILIDAHGTDHGLRVECSNREVTIVQWGELCEPDESGSYRPHLHETTMTLAECLVRVEFGHHSSQKSRVISGALSHLFHFGGEETFLDDDDRPSDHFIEDLVQARKDQSGTYAPQSQ